MVLGLHLGSALGGFAAEGSKYMDDERKRANKLIDDAMDKWETKGSANWNTHVANKKATRKLARALKPYLSVDQIGVALEQGRGEEVLAEIRKFNNMSDDAKAKAGYSLQNVVDMGDNYESSGMTMDEMINNVVGKVSGGMSLSDAFADTGQSKGITFDRLFNPNMNKLAKKRIEAIESISGKGSVANLRNYATGTVTPTDLPFTGTINLSSALAEKEFMDKVGGSGGYITSSSFNSLIKTDMAGILESEISSTTGDFTVPNNIKEELGANIKAELQNYVREQQVEYNKDLPQDQKGKYTDAFRLSLANGMKDIVEKIRNPDNTGNRGGGNRTAEQVKADMNAAKKKVEMAGFNDSEFQSDTWKANYVRLLQELDRAEGKPPSSVDTLMTLAEKVHDDELRRGRNTSKASTDSSGLGGYALEGQRYRTDK